MIPEISVVIPCYNAGAFLPTALDSLRTQTFRDFEIVIVDDGSTDAATIALLDALPADIRVIRQENRGLAGARNTGFSQARGRYILPLDCDDWLAPDFLAQTRQAMGEQPRCFAFAWLNLHGEKQGVLRKQFNLFEQLFLNQLPYCLLLPRAAWVEVGGYDEGMRRGYEDWDFNIRLGLAGWSGIAVSAPLFNYRVSGNGMLMSISARRHAELWGYIQNKNRPAYSLCGLVGLWRRWRRQPSTYPLAAYFLIWLAYRLLPLAGFNRLFGLVRPFSHSARQNRRRSA